MTWMGLCIGFSGGAGLVYVAFMFDPDVRRIVKEEQKELR